MGVRKSGARSNQAVAGAHHGGCVALHVRVLMCVFLLHALLQLLVTVFACLELRLQLLSLVAPPFHFALQVLVHLQRSLQRLKDVFDAAQADDVTMR
jgi:hypothetical protein